MSVLIQSHSSQTSSKPSPARPVKQTIPNLSLAARSRPPNSKPASLLATCQRALIHHADHLDQFPPIPDLLPLHLIEPVIKKITRPHVLEDLQTRAPHLAEYTEPLWRAFIIRDFAFGKEKLADAEVRDPAMWPEIYQRFKRKKERDQKRSVAALKKAVQETSSNGGGLVIKPTAHVEPSSTSSYRRRTAASTSGGYGSSVAKKDFFGRLKHEAVSKSVHRAIVPPILGKRTATQAQLHATGARKVLRPPADMVADLKESSNSSSSSNTNSLIRAAKAPPSNGKSEHDFVFGSKERVREISRPLWAPGEKPERPGAKGRSMPGRAASGPLWDPDSGRSSSKRVNGVVEPYDLTKDREQRLRDLKAGKTSASTPARMGIQQQADEGREETGVSLSSRFLEDDSEDDDEDDLFGTNTVRV